MASQVLVIDYGVGNLFSVARAIEHCGAEPVLCHDPSGLGEGTHAILPGVGAFATAMERLDQQAFVPAIRDFAAGGGKLLGICLGMQLLLESSEEFGEHRGLGLIPGRVVRIPQQGSDGEDLKVPHIGWNDLRPSRPDAWDETLLSTTAVASAVYFVHSFMGVTGDASDTIAYCLYNGVEIPAVIGRGAVCGTQFHPEKSGPVGLRILQRFLAQK